VFNVFFVSRNPK